MGVRSLATGALLALTHVLPGATAAQTAEDIRVTGVEFRGADTFDDRTLASAIATNTGECRTLALVCAFGITRDPYYYDEATVRADVIRLRIFYFERGFREAVVEADTTRREQTVRVVFRIQEGRPVRVADLALNGLDSIPADGMASDLPMRHGSRFDVRLYEATRDTLQRRLQNRGYPRAEVLAGYQIRADSPYTASIDFDAYPGTRARIGPIDVVGVRSLAPRVVRRMIRFREGDLYARRDLLQSQRDLFRLDIFQHVEIRTDLQAQPDSIVPVTVQVNEGDTRRMRVGGGVNQADCFSLETSWENRNFLGGARRLELRGRANNLGAAKVTGFPCGDTGEGIYAELAGQVNADFSQPFFFDPRNTFGAGLFLERRSLPDVFVRSGAGGYVSLTRDLGGNTAVTLGYRPERTRLDAADVFFCVNILVCNEEDIRVLKETNWLAPITLTLTRDRTNAIFSPTHGYQLRAELEQADNYTGSRFAYTRWTGDLAGYQGIGDVVLAGRIRMGMAWPRGGVAEQLGLNPQKRFFAGGPNSVRGFRQLELGPKVLFVDRPAVWLLANADTTQAGCTPAQVNNGSCDASALPISAFDVRPTGGQAVLEASIELRMPSPILSEKLRTAIFVDMGQVWSERGQLSLSDLVATPGFGIRYESPVGPLRMDLAYNTQGVQTLRVKTTGVQRCDISDPNHSATCVIPDGLSDAYESTDQLITLAQPVAQEPSSSFWKRFRFHFSIGQAF